MTVNARRLTNNPDHPVRLTVEFDTQEELDVFYSVFNFGAVADAIRGRLPGNAPGAIRSALRAAEPHINGDVDWLTEQICRRT